MYLTEQVGWWYSTTKEGECEEGKLPGDGSGCSWRTAATVKTINATCMRDRVVSLVAERDPSCWVACPGLRPILADSDLLS